MLQKCISCNITWGEKEEGEMDGYSHGLCPSCAKEKLKPHFHREQIRYSGFPCFGTARNYCDRADCKYRDICLDDNK